MINNSKLFNKYNRFIQVKTVYTEQDISNLKSVLTGNRGKMGDSDRYRLTCKLERNIERLDGIDITPEQTVKNIDWLTYYVFGKQGKVLKRALHLSNFVKDVVRGLESFKFMGYHKFRNVSWTPLYKAYDIKGNWFTYFVSCGRVMVTETYQSDDDDRTDLDKLENVYSFEKARQEREVKSAYDRYNRISSALQGMRRAAEDRKKENQRIVRSLTRK